MANTIDPKTAEAIDPFTAEARRKATSQDGKDAKDAFMKVFLAQMKMQDPMKPYDSSTMLQQLSQLTALNATQELQKTVKGLNDSMSQSQIMEASQLIGKKVQIPGDISPLIEKEGLGGSVLLTSPVSGVTITIKDLAGNVIKTIEKGASEKGVLDFSWDGLDDKGNPVKPGMCAISATAKVNGVPQGMIVSGTFKVNSVALDKTKGVLLNVDGYGSILTKDILKII